VKGVVKAILPRGLYQVSVEGGHEVVAHPVPGPKRNFVRLVVGDTVEIALSPRDTGRGRIVRKLS
jgi:translation initiation factor IF-1